MLATFVILPVHNRRDITLRCLGHLRQIGALDSARIVVVDDGSTDGTADAVRAAYPGVEILFGDGNLFWTGAIVLGMRHAMKQGAACCVWLNDDSHPPAGAIEQLVRYALASNCIASAMNNYLGCNPPALIFPYRKTWLGLRPATEVDAQGLINADASRGNLVAIPRAIVNAIGYPDAANLPHYFGDTDYTLRATRAGYRCVVDPGLEVLDIEHTGNWDESWLTTRRPLREIWRRFALRQASTYWWANWVYFRRHWGVWHGTLLFAAPYVRLTLISVVRLLLPPKWLGRLRPGRANASKS